MFIISRYYLLNIWNPDNPIILLEKRGIDVSSIEFVEITNEEGEKVYLSSSPLPIGNGKTCDKWVITTSSYSSFLYKQDIFPYPDCKWPSAVSINIIFTPKEHEQIMEKAGNIPIEKYIKDILFTIRGCREIRKSKNKGRITRMSYSALEIS